MFRILLIVLAAGSLSATPALSQALPKQQQKQVQKRESEGEAASQVQRGGLKRDRQISHLDLPQRPQPHGRRPRPL